MKSEADVRKKLKEIWGEKGRNLIWVEQSHGSTVGAADVFLPLPNGFYIPCELKFWPVRSNGEKHAIMRPTQYVFHYKASQKKMKTFFIAGDQFACFALIPGAIAIKYKDHAIPLQEIDNIPANELSQQRLFDTIMNEEFWRW